MNTKRIVTIVMALIISVIGSFTASAAPDNTCYASGKVWASPRFQQWNWDVRASIRVSGCDEAVTLNWTLSANGNSVSGSSTVGNGEHHVTTQSWDLEPGDVVNFTIGSYSQDVETVDAWPVLITPEESGDGREYCGFEAFGENDPIVKAYANGEQVYEGNHPEHNWHIGPFWFDEKDEYVDVVIEAWENETHLRGRVSMTFKNACYEKDVTEPPVVVITPDDPEEPVAQPEDKNCVPVQVAWPVGSKVFGRMVNEDSFEGWDNQVHFLNYVASDGTFAVPFWLQDGVWELYVTSDGSEPVVGASPIQRYLRKGTVITIGASTEGSCEYFDRTEAVDYECPTGDCPPATCLLQDGRFVWNAARQMYIGVDNNQPVWFSDYADAVDSGLEYYGAECSLCELNWGVTANGAWFGPGATVYDLTLAIAKYRGHEEPTSDDAQDARNVSANWQHDERPEEGGWYSFSLVN